MRWKRVTSGASEKGSAGGAPVFGLLKRGGRLYTKIIPDASGATLMPIIERKVVPDSIVYSDCWKAYNVFDVSDFKHFWIPVDHHVLACWWSHLGVFLPRWTK